MAQTQSPNLDQLSQDVGTRLANIDSSLKSLKTRIDGDTQQADAEVRSQLAKVSADIEANKPKLAAAEAQMAQWAQTQKSATTQKIAEWKASQDFGKLQARAADAERYAAAARDVAVAKLNDAHQAVLEAFLAKKDASGASRPS
jgi:hypothetical protein